MSFRVALRRSKELYREGGARELTRGIRDHLSKAIHSDGYRNRRVDNDDRWAFISSHLDSDVQTLVDVGCAEGEFTARAAAMGLDAVEIDRDFTRLQTARKAHAEHDTLRFEQAELDPDSIADLPEADVFLFLTVHHHWVKAYGWDAAEAMFQTLAQKADTIFYETPGHLPIRESVKERLDPGGSVAYYTDLIESTLGDAVSIVDVTTTDYMDDTDRRDPLFALDTSVGGGATH